MGSWNIRAPEGCWLGRKSKSSGDPLGGLPLPCPPYSCDLSPSPLGRVLSGSGEGTTRTVPESRHTQLANDEELGSTALDQPKIPGKPEYSSAVLTKLWWGDAECVRDFPWVQIDIPVVTAWHRRTQKSLWMYVWVHEEYKEKRKKRKVIFLGSQQLVPVSVNKNATHILRPSNMPLCWPGDYPLWGSLYYSCFYVFTKCLCNETICVL